MPKSKVRKKVATASAQASSEANVAAATSARTRVAAPSGPVYLSVMLGLMVLGLLWLVVFYLWGSNIPFMDGLGNWNFAIGFVLMVGGLLMTMGWR